MGLVWFTPKPLNKPEPCPKSFAFKALHYGGKVQLLRPVGLNLGILRGSGDIVNRVTSKTTIPTNYGKHTTEAFVTPHRTAGEP